VSRPVLEERNRLLNPRSPNLLINVVLENIMRKFVPKRHAIIPGFPWTDS
jgi:hypothetical protein